MGSSSGSDHDHDLEIIILSSVIPSGPPLVTIHQRTLQAGGAAAEWMKGWVADLSLCLLAHTRCYLRFHCTCVIGFPSLFIFKNTARPLGSSDMCTVFTKTEKLYAMNPILCQTQTWLWKHLLRKRGLTAFSTLDPRITAHKGRKSPEHLLPYTQPGDLKFGFVWRPHKDILKWLSQHSGTKTTSQSKANLNQLSYQDGKCRPGLSWLEQFNRELQKTESTANSKCEWVS